MAVTSAMATFGQNENEKITYPLPVKDVVYFFDSNFQIRIAG
jgi:hypothetical protein